MHHTSSTSSARDFSDWKIACAIALLTLAVYLAISGFHFVSEDELNVFVVARNLLGRGSLDADSIAWLGRSLMGAHQTTAIGIDGHSYSVKEIGATILAIPFVLVGRLLGISPVRAIFLLTPMLTALTTALLYLFIRELGYSKLTALLGALIYGLASPALAYSRTLFTQPEAAFGLLIALWGVTAVQKTRSWHPAFWTGVGVGIAGISVLPLWITLPIHMLFLIPWKDFSPGRRKLFLRSTLKTGIAFGAGSGLFILAQGLYDLLRFGSILQTGHQLAGVLNLSPAYFGVGSFGLLLSTPRGLVWNMPLVLLVPLGIALAIRHRQMNGTLQLAALQVISIFLFYSFYRWWMIGGPRSRYWVPVMPALVLLIVPWLEYLLAKRVRLGWLLTGILALVTVPTQILGYTIDVTYERLRLFPTVNIPMPPPNFFYIDPALVDIATSPQIWAFSQLRQGHWDVLWLSRGSIDWLVFVPLIMLIVLAVLALFFVLNDSASHRASALLATQTLLSVGVIGLVFSRYPHPSGFSPTEKPAIPGSNEIVAALSNQARSGDALLSLFYPEASYAWLDIYDGSRPDTGLTVQPELDNEAKQHLPRIERTYNRIWLISTGTMGGNPENAVEQWVAQRGYAGSETWFGGFRLIPYTFDHQGMALQPKNSLFDNGAFALAEYAADVAEQGDRRWINVWLRWKVQRQLSDNYSVFVHLRDSNGQVVAQHDGWPVSGFAPTAGWAPGSTIDDRHLILLPDDLPSGDYRVFAGIYNPTTSKRIGIVGGGEDVLLYQIHLDGS